MQSHCVLFLFSPVGFDSTFTVNSFIDDCSCCSSLWLSFIGETSIIWKDFQFCSAIFLHLYFYRNDNWGTITMVTSNIFPLFYYQKVWSEFANMGVLSSSLWHRAVTFMSLVDFQFSSSTILYCYAVFLYRILFNRSFRTIWFFKCRIFFQNFVQVIQDFVHFHNNFHKP